jgi:hypothetical protein
MSLSVGTMKGSLFAVFPRYRCIALHGYSIRGKDMDGCEPGTSRPNEEG